MTQLFSPSGIGSAGSLSCGSGDPSDGTLVNADVRGDGVLAVAGFEFNQPSEIDSWQTLLVLNQEPHAPASPRDPGAASLPPVGTLPGAVIGPLSEGTSDVSFLLLRAGEIVPDVLGIAPTPDRALLIWCASEAADLVGYRIYTDGGDDQAPVDQLADEVTLIDADPIVDRQPDTGTGTGRIRLTGLWAEADPINGALKVEVLAGGQWRATGPGIETDPEPIHRGVEYVVPEGLALEFLDPPSTYDEGDEWETHVGPRRWWLSDSLPPGPHRYQVVAFDAAGNESTVAGPVTFTATEPIPAPVNPTATWNHAEERVELEWESAGAGIEYRIYANWDGLSEALEPYIAEGHLAQTDALAYNLALGFVPDAVVLLEVRSVHVASGAESSERRIIRVRASEEPVAGLGAPTISEARAIAGGEVRVRIALDLLDGVPEEIAIYASTTGEWGDATEITTVEFEPDASPTSGVLVATQTWESDGDFAAGVEVWIGARLVDGDGNEGPDSNLVAVTPDDTAPDAPDCIAVY